MQCIKCGKPLDVGVKFCNKCGTKQTGASVAAPNSGPIPNAARKVTNLLTGEAVDPIYVPPASALEQTASVSAAQAAVSAVVVGATVPGSKKSDSNGKKEVDKAVYAMLALFLGWAGGHKFYAGKTGRGVVYMLFFCTLIPWFISIVELIIALRMPADKNGKIKV